MIVPIWSAAWELDCCQPEAEVGLPWSVPVTFAAAAGPWWAARLDVPLSPEQLVLGTIGVEVVRSTADGDPPHVATVGPLRFLASPDLEDGRHVGRLHLDAHGGHGPAVQVSGVATEVVLVPILHRDQGDRLFLPAAQLDVRSAQSTLERLEVDEGASDDWVATQMLVWLRLDEDQPA